MAALTGPCRIQGRYRRRRPDYIAALLGGLQRIADNARLHSLTYVLGLAIKEAKGQKVQQG
jgi:hypothetical protein